MLQFIKKYLKLKSVKNRSKCVLAFLENISKADSDFLSELQIYMVSRKLDIRCDELNFALSQDVWEILKKPLLEIFPGLQPFNDEEYFLYNQDVRKAIGDGQFQSGVEHFIKYGLTEVYLGCRQFPGAYKDEVDECFFTNAEPFFDKDLYVESVKSSLGESIKKDGAWEHFKLKGFDLVKHGKMEIYPNSGLYSHQLYLKSFTDVAATVLLGHFTSPLEHFFYYGAKEVASGRRQYLESNSVYFYVLPQLSNSILEEICSFEYKPLISIVMPVYNVASKWLQKAYASLEAQWYENWELCICDDGSTSTETLTYLKELQLKKNVKVYFSKINENISIASNHALKQTTGEFIALMDNDDELTPDALYEVVKVLQNRSVDFIYSDEDKIELSGEYTDVHFKPDYSPEMFMSHNYLSHLGVIRTKLIKGVGGWHTGFEGAQDYDLYLRVLEHTSSIVHIPKVLYHWRKIPGSTAAEFSEKSYAQDAGKKALIHALERRKVEGEVLSGKTPGTYRVRYSISEKPKVSIIIPFRDEPELLVQCLDSILRYSKGYSNFEVICIDNNSTDTKIVELKEHYLSTFNRITFHNFDEEFNYSKINNVAVRKYASGEYLIFMNNDVEVIDNEWLVGLLELCLQPHIGAVGAKLMYPNNTVQHAGLILAPDTGHAIINAFKNFDEDYPSYFARLHTISNYSAVTAALMMVSKSDFNNVGGFDEERLPVAYNDVDFCLKLIELGRYNVYTPFVKAYHHESATRGLDEGFIKLNRSRRELSSLKELRKPHFLKPDRFYSSNLSQYTEDFAVTKSNSSEYSKVLPKNFYENIIFEKQISEISKTTLTFFSHYDKDGLIEDYIVEYLKRISGFSDIIFISTSCEISDQNLSEIYNYVNHIIVKENVGYDFGAWRTGIVRFYKHLSKFENIIICNDSVYGPVSSSFNPVSILESRDLDALAITDNYDIQY
ncbi:glycosyltransferase, partial [Paraglaciecola sp.]|uniref:glycosyltransferase family 2 protein n=1 Tax=Paraglaciecola sp. TaxID=1920173 RepID=UPI003297D624